MLLLHFATGWIRDNTGGRDCNYALANTGEEFWLNTILNYRVKHGLVYDHFDNIHNYCMTICDDMLAKKVSLHPFYL